MARRLSKRTILYMDLAEKISKINSLATSGPIVLLSSEPSEILRGSDRKVLISAIFRRAARETFQPVLRCMESPRFKISLKEVRKGSAADKRFEIDFTVDDLPTAPKGYLTLVLEPTPDSEPVASLTLPILSDSDLREVEDDDDVS